MLSRTSHRARHIVDPILAHRLRSYIHLLLLYLLLSFEHGRGFNEKTGSGAVNAYRGHAFHLLI